ncbi:MAG: hypothetical protein R3B98_03100 [Hyphomonas sp.]
MRLLPILWFILAALGAAALFVAGGSGASPIISTAASAAGGAVSAIATGLVYLLIKHTRPSLAVAIIGYSHLFLATAARIGQAAAEQLRGQMLAGNGSTDWSSIGLAFSAAGLANILGGIVFILALIVALNTRDEKPEDVF